MSTPNPFPLQIVDKVNSPELLAALAQFGSDKYADGVDINEVKQALNFLYEALGSPGGNISPTPFYRTLTYAATPIFDLGKDVCPMAVVLNQGRFLNFGTEWTMVGSTFTSLYDDHSAGDVISITGYEGTMPAMVLARTFGEEFSEEFE